MAEEVDLVAQTLERVEATLDELVVRGLRSAGPGELSALAVLAEELDRVGAAELSARIAALIEGIRADQRSAAATLLGAQASLRVFQRILTLDVAEGLLAPPEEPA